ncbi:MAG TPA: S8 family serine peptidase [Oscillatoriaceae cyanobacterium]
MKKLTLALLPLLIVACQGNPPLQAPLSTDAVPDQLVVRFQPNATAADRVAARALVGASQPMALLPDAERWTLPEGTDLAGAIARLRTDDRIKVAEPNRRHQLDVRPGARFTPPRFLLDVASVQNVVVPNDPDYHLQWDLPVDKFDQVWSTNTGQGVIVGVIDSGVDPNHPDLKANLLPLIDEVVAMGNHDVLDTVNYDGRDGHGHGTHVCGIVGAVANNGIGISGAAPGIKILPVKVTTASGDADDATITKGIKDAVDKGAQVINLSIGGPQPSNVLLDALNYAFDKNVAVVIAAGNDSSDVNYPAQYDGVISVGATTASGTVPAYSSHGNQLVLVAPGGGVPDENNGPGIFSCIPTYPCWISKYEGKGAPDASGQPSQIYDYLAGTSMSAPQVTAAVALLLSQNPGLSPAQVRTRMAATAVPLGSAPFDPFSGFGALNVQKLLSATRDDGGAS